MNQPPEFGARRVLGPLEGVGHDRSLGRFDLFATREVPFSSAHLKERATPASQMYFYVANR
jgi:hypothetical protein